MVQKIKLFPFLLGYLLFALVLIGAIIGYQQGHWVLFMSENRTPFLNNLFQIWTLFGEEVFYIFSILIVSFRSVRNGLMAILSAPLVLTIVYFLKTYLAHPRPKVYLESIDKILELKPIEGVHFIGGAMSFPSGHTAAGFAICTFLAISFNHKALQLMFLILAIGVGVSRIYLGQHFPKDVLFGSFLGIILVLFAQQLSIILLKDSKYNNGILALFRKESKA